MIETTVTEDSYDFLLAKDSFWFSWEEFKNISKIVYDSFEILIFLGEWGYSTGLL